MSAVLFVRNFDSEFEDDAAQAQGAQADTGALMMTVTEAEMLAEQAKATAYEEGMIAGSARALAEERDSRQARTADALATLAQTFGELSARDKRLRSEVELEISELVVAIGERLLPDLFDAHGGDILIARIRSAVHLAIGTGQVGIRIPLELEEALTPHIETLIAPHVSDMTQFAIHADPQIDDGTIRVDWRNGSLEYDPGLASEEALDTLRQAISELKLQQESVS